MFSQTNPPPNDYNNEVFVFNYISHTVSPSWCGTTVTCNNVDPRFNAGVQCKELVGNSISWQYGETAYKTANFAPPGVYTYTFDVKVNGGVVTRQFTFDIQLIDPCASNTISTTTPLNTGTITYYITDPTSGLDTVLNPRFSSDPTWCAQQLTFSAPGLSSFTNWNSSTQTVTYNRITNSLALAGEINPLTNPDLTEEYTVTVTYQVLDYYGQAAKTQTISYDVAIKNPCINQSYVTISDPVLIPQTYIIATGDQSYTLSSASTVSTLPITH